MNKPTMSWLFLCGLMLIISGCSSNSEPANENEASLRIVLEQLYTGPDEELLELMNDPANQTVVGEGVEPQEETDEATELDAYLEELYRPHFSEETYESFIAVNAQESHLIADQSNCQMNVDSMNIEEADTTSEKYNFTVHLDCERDDDPIITAEITGNANFSDEGDISRFTITDDDDFYSGGAVLEE